MFFNSFKVTIEHNKIDNFIENIFWKMTHFQENIFAETNSVIIRNFSMNYMIYRIFSSSFFLSLNCVSSQSTFIINFVGNVEGLNVHFGGCFFLWQNC